VSLQSRQQILNDLADTVGHPVLALVNGDRQNLQTQLAQDVLTYLPRHLDALGRAEQLGLLLYTRGGETNAAWPIANFLREYAPTIRIFVPSWAHSAGTLLSLAADRIYMSRFASLSPIDPSVANAFNPPDPANPANRLQIAVEDVLAYFKLAERYGAKRGDAAARVFLRIAESVEPLALGNVQRSIDQIRQLATKMIRLHSTASDRDVTELVHRLTTALYSHMHFINRHEAKEIGLPIDDDDTAIETLLLNYHAELKADLLLTVPFDPAAELRAAGVAAQGQPLAVSYERCYLDTPTTCDAFVTEGLISQQPQQMLLGQVPGLPLPQAPAALPLAATLEVTREGWLPRP
jgi:hypothetical protein